MGPVRLTAGGVAPPQEVLWRKHLALLVYLARSPRRTRSRAHLVGLLWPDKDEGAARHSLNEALRVLRKALGPDGIEATAEQVRLAQWAIELDVDRLVALVERERWREASELVLGVFLEGFGLSGAGEFEDWLAAERQQWTALGVRALLGWARALLDQGHALQALAAAERALRLAPTSEPAIEIAVQADVVGGNRTSALERLEDFSGRLEKDLGMGLSPALSALAERLRQAAARGPTRPADLGPNLRRPPLAGRERELAVLLGWWRGLDRPTLGVLSGDLGMGKSRLLEELAARVALDGGTVAAIRAVPADRDAPWSGLLGLATGPLAGAAGLSGAAPGAIATFSRIAPEWAARFPGAGASGPPLPPARALSEILRAVADVQAVMVLVDDAEWLDDDSARALEAALRDLAGCRFLLVLARSPHHAQPVLDEIETRVGHDFPGGIVPVGPLASAGLTELCRWAFPSYRPDELERLVRRVSTDSAGIPLLASALIHSVAEGTDDTSPAAWPEPLRTLEDSMPGDLPDALIAALRVGFRRLSKPAQAVLAAASLLPDRITAAGVGRVAELTPPEVDLALDELEWNRWLGSEPRGYSFVARIAKDVVRNDMLTPGQRRRLEARAAEPSPA